MTAPFGIAPTHDDELLAVEAFRLEPCASARLVECVHALRDYALKSMLTGQPVELRPAPELVISKLEARRCICQPGRQPGLALDQRQPAQIRAIEEQQIEQEK